MAKNFFSGLFGGKKNDDDKTPAENTGVDAAQEATPTSPSPPLAPQDQPPAEPAVQSPRPKASPPQQSAPPKTNEPTSATTTASVTEAGPIAPRPAMPVADIDPPQPLQPQPEPPRPAQPIAQPTPAAETPAEDTGKEKSGWFSRLKSGLSRTSSKLSDGVTSIFAKRKLDDEALEELEDLLITSDLGVTVASKTTAALAKDKFDKEVTDAEVRTALAGVIGGILHPVEKPLEINSANRPHVILMTGVNGAGKTTTIGKLAAKFKTEGKSVMFAAGDTFRAAAIEQLTAWGERTGSEVIAKEVGADAAGLAFDALQAAQAANVDVLLIDTAGRLQNRKELMDELAKIVRVIRKIDATAPHDTLLVLDATVGQNAISQTQTFKEIAEVSGLVMTKLDGTARGGVLVALAEKFALPIHFIGVGETVDDLQPFRADAFSRALAGGVDERSLASPATAPN